MHLADSVSIKQQSQFYVNRGPRTDSDTSNTNPLLHDLEPDNQLNSTANVEFPGLVPEQHGKVRVAVRNGLLEFRNILNVAEFCVCPDRIFALVSAQAAKDIARFLLTTNLD